MLIQTTNEQKKDVNHVIEYFIQKLDKTTLDLIEEATRSQFKSNLWHELRYARITALKVYEVSRCQTPDGLLVAAIIGAKTPDTPAMKRGRKLKSAVIKIVQNK
ncbi:unnamed protein product [Euphydryas editha]|uniref:Uncharacterized protein n=1 Tax=Euphydryas editha TaxID=104508 RepID=A0AAU9TNM8_EUPED|nr:unnamed protein product [Euphydryas editha]